MPRVIYEMGGVSADGYIVGANTTLARGDLRAELTSLQESERGDVAAVGTQ